MKARHWFITILCAVLPGPVESETLNISGQVPPTMSITLSRLEQTPLLHPTKNEPFEINLADLIASYNFSEAYSISISSTEQHNYHISYGDKLFAVEKTPTEVYYAYPTNLPKRDIHSLKLVLPQNKNPDDIHDTLVLTVKVL